MRLDIAKWNWTVRSFIVCVFPFAFAAIANGAHVTVDCSGGAADYSSVGAALAALDRSGPHAIDVAGTCRENVRISARDDLSVNGSGTAVIEAGSGPAVLIGRARGIVLRGLTIRGGRNAVLAQGRSEVTLEAVTIEDAGTGLAVFQADVTAGGSTVEQSVTITSCGSGVVIDDGSLTSNGFLIVENNSQNGIDATQARIILRGLSSGGAPATVNSIRNNGGSGLLIRSGSTADLVGKNSIDGNQRNGILAIGGAVSFRTVGGIGTVIENNRVSGAAFLFNASGTFAGATIRNNGSAGEPLSSGMTASQNATILASRTAITGTAGAAVNAYDGGMVRLREMTMSGNIEEPLRVRTGGIAELQGGNVFETAEKLEVTCDSTAILFGEGANVRTNCRKNL